MSRVFIAYAESDREKAVWIRDLLKQVGLDPWMDEEMLPCENVRSKVREEIDGCDFFLALFSKKAALEKGEFHRQLNYAMEKSEENPEDEIYIIPIRLDACKVKNEFLRDRHPLDLFHYPEENLGKLVKVLTRETGSAGGDSPSPLSQIAPESLRELAKNLKRKPGLRKRLVFWNSVCIIMILAAWQFEGVFHFHGKQTDAHLESATRFLNQGMYREAMAEYDGALKLCTDCPKALRGRKKAELFGEAAEKEINTGNMLARLENISGVSKDDPHILLLRGNLKVRAGDTEEAENLYRLAVKTEPALAEAWFGLGVLYDKQGKKENALEMFQKARAISESNFKYTNAAAWGCFETGQYARSVELYEKLLKADADYLLAHLEIARVLLMGGDRGTALKYLETLAEKIEVDGIAGLPANTGPWYFPAGGDPVVLDTLDAKKYYAWYSLGATRFLFDPASDPEGFMQKAEGLKINAEQIRMLVDWDISEMLKKYGNNAEFRKRAGEFRACWLVSPG